MVTLSCQIDLADGIVLLAEAQKRWSLTSRAPKGNEMKLIDFIIL
jgi:hypothetical protein